MKKTMRILRYELVTTLRRPSFFIIAFIVPVVAVLIFAGIDFFKGRDSDDAEEAAEPVFELAVEGYVDQSGLIEVIPDDLSPDHLLPYADEEAAREALAAGEISAYYVIPADYVERGELAYVYPHATPLVEDGQEWVILWTLLVNLLDGDMELASQVWNPMDLWSIDVAPQPEEAGTDDAVSEDVARYLPAVMAVLFYVFFMTSANLLLRSVTGEKENRTIEVLMLSVNPRELLVGKIAGLGIVGLLETVVWVGALFAIMNLGGRTLSLPEGFSLPVSLAVWGLAFFLLGFTIYASLIAGVGALTPKLKEASQALMVVMIPLIISYMVGLLAPLAGDPHGTLPLVLSLFPLTAPVVMMMRLAAGGVPFWQLALSAVLMAGTSVVIIRAAAAMFHAQHLLSGESFSLRRYARAILGR
jgi:ABC-2 type transport system permease protein